jgi:FKBP-type peptidyl-prolyl cis-trans isomerase SlyD
MQIEKHKVVTLDYTLTDNAGKVIDSSDNGQFAYLHGAGNIIPGLEKALNGKTAGHEETVNVEPADGYGERDASKMAEISRDMFPSDIEIAPGMPFEAQGPDGQTLMITVVKVDGDQVTVDANHPLAGETLNFDVKVVDVRDATDEEISHGHVHGPGGHHHG